jgi:hypothetical protein
MNQGPSNRRALSRVLVPVAVLHGVCCGGLLLWLLLGSAGIAALGSHLGDPLILAAALLLLGGGGLAAWRSRRRRRAAAVTEPGGGLDRLETMGTGDPHCFRSS